MARRDRGLLSEKEETMGAKKQSGSKADARPWVAEEAEKSRERRAKRDAAKKVVLKAAKAAKALEPRSEGNAVATTKKLKKSKARKLNGGRKIQKAATANKRANKKGKVKAKRTKRLEKQ